MRFIFFMVSACLTICCHAQVKERVSSAQQRSIAAPVSTEDSITTAINAMFEQMRQDIETNFAKLILEKKKEKAELESRPNTANQQLVKLNQEIAKLDGSVNNIQQLMNVLANRLDSLHRIADITGSLIPAKNKVQHRIDSLITVKESTLQSVALLRSQIQPLQQKSMSEENAKLKAIAAIPAQIAALENEKKKMLDELEQSRLKVLAEAQKLRRETSSHAFLSKTKTDYSRLVQDSLRQVNNRFARRQ